VLIDTEFLILFFGTLYSIHYLTPFADWYLLVALLCLNVEAGLFEQL